MEEPLIYIIKSSLVIALFYLCFRLLLQNETFFTTKRWFLIIGIVMALIFPFVIIEKIIFVPSLEVNEVYSELLETTETVAAPINWMSILFKVYVLGCFLFLVRMMVQFLSLFKMIAKGEKHKAEGYVFVEVTTETNPFSFFNYIVYNSKNHTTTDLNTIIAHEKVHIDQKHTLDMLLLQFLVVLQWVNPFAWWYKKVAAQNLEYIADEKVANIHSNKKKYQYLLLQQSTNTLESLSFTNNFFNSITRLTIFGKTISFGAPFGQVKKRIAMLNRNRSKKQSLIKMGVMLPLLLGVTLLVNTKTIAQVKADKNTFTYEEVDVQYSLEVTANSTNEELKAMAKGLKEDKIKIKFSNVKRNAKGEIIAISSSFSGPNSFSGNYGVSGIEPIDTFQFYVKSDADDKITKIGYRAVKQKDIIAYQSVSNGQSGNVIIRANGNTSAVGIGGNKQKPLFVVNGVDKGTSYMNSSDLNPNDIASVTVLKDESAVALYGDKGKNGVVIITTKKDEDNDVKFKVKSSGSMSGKKPLIVIDGEIMDKSYEIEDIDKNNITHVKVIKNETAITKYGEKGKDGVILVTTKENDGKKVEFKLAKNDGNSSEIKPLIVIDGKIMDESYDYNMLKVEDIESIKVIKNDKAVAKYGEKGKNGVVIITMKK